MSNDTMRQLSELARETRSDGFAILRRDEALGDRSFERTDEPVCIMSVTKMVIAVAFGRLLDDGILASLDTLVADILPEWRQGRKRDVTVRTILNHTSGLQNDRNAGVEIEPAPDWSQLALCAELEDEPGTAFLQQQGGLLAASDHRAADGFAARCLRPRHAAAAARHSRSRGARDPHHRSGCHGEHRPGMVPGQHRYALRRGRAAPAGR